MTQGNATITAKAGDKTATCAVTVTPPNYTLIPLTLEALTEGTIVVISPKEGMQYTLNGGAKTAVSADPIDVAVGDKVAFYGTGTTIKKYEQTQISGGTAGIKVYGNIMSLLDEENFATTITLPEEYTFAEFLMANNKLTDAGTSEGNHTLYVDESMINAEWYNGNFTVTAIQ